MKYAPKANTGSRKSSPGSEPHQLGRNSLLNRKVILKRLQNDEVLLNELIELYLADTPGLLAEAREALDKGDAPRLQRVAHTLKGVLGNFEADHAVEVAWRLEALARSGDLQQGVKTLNELAMALAQVESEIKRLVS